MSRADFVATELGLLPRDWETQCLGDITEITSSRRVFQRDWRTSGVPFYRARELVVLSERGRVNNTLFIEPQMYEQYSRMSGALSEGDLLVTGVGTLGITYVVKTDDRFYFKDGNIIWIKRSNKLDPRFLEQLYRTPVLRSQVLGESAGTTVGTYTITNAKKTRIPLPPIEEQRRIAEALADADRLIAAIETLVEKKRAIRQGMAQTLLSAGTRLPGFTGVWGESPLGAVAKIKTGSRNNEDKDARGRYPFFVRSAKVERISTYSYDCEAILVPGEGGIGSIFHFINGKFEVHQRVYCISEFSSRVVSKYVYYFMQQFFGPHAMENSVKATVDSLRLPTFLSFRLNLPPTTEEQRAIAEVLTDADDEIGALELRLSKARKLKQGMMQELLTGRTRLVPQGVSA